MSAGKNSSRPAAKPPKKRRLKRHPLLWIVLLLLVWWFNNYTLKTSEFGIESPKISGKVRLAVISDQHATKHGISNDTIVKRISGKEPDAVFILGDMYTSGSSWDVIQIPIDLTQELVDEGYPVFFVSGDHDLDERYIQKIAETGAHVMNYTEEYVNLGGNTLHIMGIDNAYYSPTFDLAHAFTLDSSCFNIVMAHIPYYEKFAQFGADLTLCADTHGGMIQLPFGLGPVYDSDSGTWFPKLRNSAENVFDKGIFEYSGGKMFVSSGIGVSPLPVRFNNRPEIDIIELKGSD